MLNVSLAINLLLLRADGAAAPQKKHRRNRGHRILSGEEEKTLAGVPPTYYRFPFPSLPESPEDEYRARRSASAKFSRWRESRRRNLSDCFARRSGKGKLRRSA
ncbi:unnamed protein product [Cuscuta europaea]|uniref:Secreted protein n=1 Tax=Cuscuta europaea TaxID=41803 RepID=A0A9P0YGY9_CUSEU|nr:unnamed protein product [Cuscuta europaea]